MDNVRKASFKINRDEFFTYWLALTQPLHNLTKTNIKVLIELLKIRLEYSTKIIDDEVLDDWVFESKNRKRVMDALDLSVDRFNNILSDLRRSGVIIDNRINKAFVPNITNESTKYNIVFELNLE